MKTTRITLMLAFVAVSVVGCGGGETAESTAAKPALSDFRRAIAQIGARSDSTVRARAIFLYQRGTIDLKIDVEDAPPGKHAIHIHEKGDCSAPDGSSAGGHWNPHAEDHGAWGTPPHHLGDIGNITIGSDGSGVLTLTTDKWQVGDGSPTDIVGKSIIIHAAADDFKTQPTGAAGGRIACGVVELQQG